MKATSGIQGLEEAQHNLGCLEPDNLTVDTRRLGASLRQRLEDRGVTFVMGREGRLVTQGTRVVGVALGGGDRLEADRSVVVGRGVNPPVQVCGVCRVWQQQSPGTPGDQVASGV